MRDTNIKMHEVVTK